MTAAEYNRMVEYNQNELSIIIPTHCRCGQLEKCLDSIAASSGLPNEFQVVVVDNGAEPDLDSANLCRSEKYAGLTLQSFYQPVAGTSAARNFGAVHTDSEWLGFVDDDAILPEGWLENALKIIHRDQPDIFGGPYIPYYSCDKPAWFLDEYGSGSHGGEAHWLVDRSYLSATNIIVKRSVFTAIGGFSTRYGGGAPIAFGEETDLQYRAAQEGYTIWYDPELFVYHHVAPGKMHLNPFFKRASGHGQAKAFIFLSEFEPGNQKVRSSTIARRLSYRFSALLKRTFELLGKGILIPFRNRQKYPYYQQYVIDQICPKISNIALQWNLMRIDLQVSQSKPLSTINEA